MHRTDEGPGFLAADDGKYEFLTILAVMFFLVLFALVGNVSRCVVHKIEVQNAADSIAYSSSTVMARGMNTVTAANHTIGQLGALWVLHHALGGDDLDEGKCNSYQFTKVTEALYKVAKKSAININQDGQPLGNIRAACDDQIKAGLSLLQSKRQLRDIYLVAMVVHAIGAILEKIPIVQIVGYVLSGIATVIELKCMQEYLVLDGLEMLAIALSPIKRQIPIVVSALQGAVHAIVITTPKVVEAAVKKVSEDNRVEGFTHPPLVLLPIIPDQTSDWRLTQLVRTTYPWVHFWRQQLIRLGNIALTLSRFEHHYKKQTDAQTKEWHKVANVSLYTMFMSKGDEKGNEDWTKNSLLAERLFTVMGFARRKVSADSFLSKTVLKPFSDSFVTYAQALIYNANPVQTGSGQPVLGWDTLNWEASSKHVIECPSQPHPIGGWVMPKLGEIGRLFQQPSGDDLPAPDIKLNWRNKLVPATRITEAALLGLVPLPEITRLQLVPPEFRTH